MEFRIFAWPIITTRTISLQKLYVRSLFDAIASRYDLLNHLLSGGIDFYWRKKAIDALRGLSPKNILDVATGTADFALASLRLDPHRVVGVDLAENMLAVGQQKLNKRKVADRISLRMADAECLPFGPGEFDAAIVAFGVRNFENLDAGISEMHRVLRPGGRIVVLEFSRPRSFPFKQLYYTYFLHVLPAIGKIVSKHDEAYRYLPETVLRFPEGRDFLVHLERAGFTGTYEERLTFGIATMYLGTKPPTIEKGK